ncbi:unnamed protein product [Brassica rapa]|uniref:Uncharacterized protein n=1 Tax=Brassica campestris TaxID=3711 RepID=A0A3P6BZK0_BRACM|nr:unnamed protein product [Brassica rapa]VDD06454.1 unnamed protein product [Brassica rapa]
MVELYCICGKWIQNDRAQWEFVVDTTRLGSLSEIDQNVPFNVLVTTVTEDLDVPDKDIALSYGVPLDARCAKPMIQNTPPVDIRNDRQLRAYMNKIKEEGDRRRNPPCIPLCVALFDKPKPRFSCSLGRLFSKEP